MRKRGKVVERQFTPFLKMIEFYTIVIDLVILFHINALIPLLTLITLITVITLITLVSLITLITPTTLYIVKNPN